MEKPPMPNPNTVSHHLVGTYVSFHLLLSSYLAIIVHHWGS